jgi:hypothetical protein
MPHHVRNSSDFIQTIDLVVVSPEDITVSFGVVSLFTCVPLKETVYLLYTHFACVRSAGNSTHQKHNTQMRKTEINMIQNFTEFY